MNTDLSLTLAEEILKEKLKLLTPNTMEGLNKRDSPTATKYHKKMLIMAGMAGCTLAFLACYLIAAVAKELLK